MELTNDERTLLLLYFEENRVRTIANLTAMRSELQTDERELFQLTNAVICKLENISDDAFQSLDLFEMG